MPVTPTYPGVYIDEIPSAGHTIPGVATSITAFVGRAATGPTNEPLVCFSFGDFQKIFGGLSRHYPLGYAVEDFFLNGGGQAIVVRVRAAAGASADGDPDETPLADSDIIGDRASRTGMFALEHADLFNLLCIPWDRRGVDLDPSVRASAAAYCVSRRAVYIADSPMAWTDLAEKGQLSEIDPGQDLGITDAAGQRNSAVYFPRIKKPDSETSGQIEVFPACGMIAGQIARTDLARGVWIAPAGMETGLAGVTDLEIKLTDSQQAVLNPLAVNCLRTFPVHGPVIWGARTLRGADLLSDDYKYLQVRRLTLYIEESLYRGTKFAAFEPNDEALWSQLRLTIGAFMAGLERQGAFFGHAVTCDQTTTTQYDIDRGICNVQVAFAPVKPAEFIVLQIQQQAGQAAA